MGLGPSRTDAARVCPPEAHAVGNFRHRSAKSRGQWFRSASRPSNPWVFLDCPWRMLVQLLRVRQPSVHVFRTTLVVIVLILAIGQDASMLCGTWCSKAPVTSSRCSHNGKSTTLALKSTNDCKPLGSDSAVLGREDTQRDKRYQGPQSTRVVLTDLLPRFVSNAGARRGSSLQPPLLVIALRI